MNTKKALRLCVTLLSLFMIFFPAIRFSLAWEDGMLILSPQLLLMFICELFGLGLTFHKKTWEE